MERFIAPRSEGSFTTGDPFPCSWLPGDDPGRLPSAAVARGGDSESTMAGEPSPGITGVAGAPAALP